MIAAHTEGEFEDFSVAFQHQPYDVLLNVFLFCPGIKAVASLQRTCKRCYEIGSEEDFIWKVQCKLYPTIMNQAGMDEGSVYFVGYWYALRAFVTSSKNNALAALINRIHSNGYWTAAWQNSAGCSEQERAVLANASEISLAKGVCMGPQAASIFLSSPIAVGGGRNAGAWQLDTLDLSGQRLRGEGMAILAKACRERRLPFLRNLALRHDKLGVTLEDAVASGAALKTISDCCPSLDAVDLTDNSIGGTPEYIKAILCNGQLRLPRRLWLDENWLGTAGATMVLEHAIAQMDAFGSRPGAATAAAASSGGAAASTAASAALNELASVVPHVLSLRDCGIGYDHTTSNAGASGSSPRSKHETCITLLAAMAGLMRRWLDLAAALSEQRAASRVARLERGKGNRGANVSVLAEKSLLRRQNAVRGDAAAVVSILDLSSKTAAAAAAAAGAGGAAAAASGGSPGGAVSPTTGTFGSAAPLSKGLENALPAGLPAAVLSDKKSPSAIAATAVLSEAGTKRMTTSTKGGARLLVAWPRMDGENPSSCVVQ